MASGDFTIKPLVLVVVLGRVQLNRKNLDLFHNFTNAFQYLIQLFQNFRTVGQ